MLVERTSPDRHDFTAFLNAADARSSSLYGIGRRPGSNLAALVSADVRFFVAWSGGRASGCGGYGLLSQENAEMKRLFVDPTSRGQGVGGALFRAIEQSAADEGIRDLFLETGIKSEEALRLYHRLGFERCDAFGDYGPDPLSVFMVKRLVFRQQHAAPIHP